MDAKELRSMSETITNTEGLDIIYNEVLLPRLKGAAESKQTYLEVRENMYRTAVEELVKKHTSTYSLQKLIETTMKPYLQAKGFKVITYSPNYLVKIAW